MQEFPLPSLPVCGKGGKLRRKWNEIADGIYKNLNEKNRDTSSWKNIQFHSEIIILRTRREQDTVSTLKYVTALRWSWSIPFVTTFYSNVITDVWNLKFRIKKISFFLNTCYFRLSSNI